MKVTRKYVRQLEHLWDTSVAESRSLKLSCKRIMILGIMLNLLIVVANVYSTFQIIQAFKQVLQEKGLLKSSLDLKGMQNTEKSKYLAHIFEVGGPVGMDPVGNPAVPSCEPFFVSSLWSFGADQCASSEGFLVTFTPRGVEVIFCDYPVLAENCVESFHFWQTLKGTFLSSAYSQSGGDAIQDVVNYQVNEPDRHLRSLVAALPLGGTTQEKPKMISLHFSLARRVRHNLMMTTPQGILVALNPTDEGRIGTGRNTLRSYDESNS